MTRCHVAGYVLALGAGPPALLYYSRLMDHYGVPEGQAAAYNGGPYSYRKNRAAQKYQKNFNSHKVSPSLSRSGSRNLLLCAFLLCSC